MDKKVEINFKIYFQNFTDDSSLLDPGSITTQPIATTTKEPSKETEVWALNLIFANCSALMVHLLLVIFNANDCFILVYDYHTPCANVSDSS